MKAEKSERVPDIVTVIVAVSVSASVTWMACENVCVPDVPPMRTPRGSDWVTDADVLGLSWYVIEPELEAWAMTTPTMVMVAIIACRASAVFLCMAEALVRLSHLTYDQSGGVCGRDGSVKVLGPQTEEAALARGMEAAKRVKRRTITTTERL